MSLKFKKKWTANGNEFSIGELIQNEVYSAPDYHHGEIESLRAKLDKLVDIVDHISGTLTDTQQGIVAGLLHYEVTS